MFGYFGLQINGHMRNFEHTRFQQVILFPNSYKIS